MAKYYTNQAFIDYGKQQIIENNDIIKAWKIVLPIAKKFDGKVINKRFTSAIDDELSKTFKYAHATIDKFDTYFRLNLMVRDNDYYRVGEFSCNYVEYKSSAYCQGIVNHCIDYEKLEKSVNERIDELNQTNNQLDYEVNNIDEVEKQFRHIINQIDMFNKGTSYYLHDLYKFR